ncbi:MAG: MDR family NADPH-dependent oxidoreductase [Puniceicoccaceae bacterium]
MEGNQRAISLVHERFGDPSEVLEVRETEIPAPGPGEVLIRMEAAAIHPSDLGMVGGSYGRLRDLPAVAGREGVGKVVATGAGVDDEVWLDRRVRMVEDEGVWRSHQIAAAAELSAVPQGVSAEQAALSAVNPTTALRLLEDFARLRPGDWIVQNAGNSAVGLAVIQFAAARGLRTASLVRRKELFAPLEDLGADLVVLDERGAVETIRGARGGDRMPLGLNSVGGSSVLNLAGSVSEGGTVVTFGAMTGEKIRFPTRQLIFSDITFRGFWMDRWNRTHPPAERQALLDRVYGAIRDGELRTPVEKVYPLRDFREALAHNASGRFGKVLFGDV